MPDLPPGRWQRWMQTVIVIPAPLARAISVAGKVGIFGGLALMLFGHFDLGAAAAIIGGACFAADLLGKPRVEQGPGERFDRDLR